MAHKTTAECLEARLTNDLGSILKYGGFILATAYRYKRSGSGYYGAIYRFTTKNHTIEGEIELVETSEEIFQDNGHAIAWALAKANA